ncbi:unnamed protein product [Orchesella dallaii]|uniref:Uncharacterized protein n=1 Tax=Orchesella dallaii TaxID=48710 RepID=A0ABP1PLS9_9HEXA
MGDALSPVYKHWVTISHQFSKMGDALSPIYKKVWTSGPQFIKKWGPQNYGDPELNKKGFEKPDDSLLDQILREGTGVIRHRSKERLGSAVSSANNPITTQKALSIWTEYIEKRVDELEEDLDPKLQVLYRTKRNWVSSTESMGSEFKLQIKQNH